MSSIQPQIELFLIRKRTAWINWRSNWAFMYSKFMLCTRTPALSSAALRSLTMG